MFKYTISTEGTFEFDTAKELAYDVQDTCYVWSNHSVYPKFLPGDDFIIIDDEGREYVGEEAYANFCDAHGLWDEFEGDSLY